MKKIKLQLKLTEYHWLAAWMRAMVQEGDTHWLPLEYHVLCECYERLIKKFTFVKEGSLTLRCSEAISIKRMLIEHVQDNTYDDMMRNFIISQLDKQCPIK